MSFVDRLFGLFEDEEVSWDAARAVGQIVAADPVLTKKNHAVIRVRTPSVAMFPAGLTRVVDPVRTKIRECRPPPDHIWCQVP